MDFSTDPLILYALCTLLYLALCARSLVRLMDQQDADNAARAEAQQKRWLGK